MTATTTAKRQFCRKCLRNCVPAVTLTFDGGTRRLHWCAEHTADADAYRPDADGDGADTTVADIRLVGPWLRDELAYDPGARVRMVEVDGHLFKVTMRIVGWPMCVKTIKGVHIGMAMWENWAEVAQVARNASEGR